MLIRPYENLTSLTEIDAISRAEEMLISRTWSRRGYPEISLTDISWALSSEAERSWNFYIHSLDMIDPLLKAHTATGKIDFLKASLQIVESWARTHVRGDRSKQSPFAWYDMAVGLRAYRLGYVLDAADKLNIIEADSSLLLWDAVNLHLEELADDSKISFHNNHGYFQIAGQLSLGRRFAERSAPFSVLAEQGEARMHAILQRQFTSEGVHREHSPDYHRMVYSTLRGLLDSGLITNDETLRHADTIEEALSWFVMPNGRLANFGDTDDRMMRESDKSSGNRWVSPMMQYAVSGGRRGVPAQESYKAFPDSGYFIVKHSPAGDADTQPSYLALTAAFHSRVHKHADDLSFVWSDQGVSILTDSGRFGYIGKTVAGSDLWKEGYWYSDPRRIYCESTRAHNTLEFDGKDSPRRKVEPYGSALRKWSVSESQQYSIEAQCWQFGTIRHVRRLFFQPGQWLVVYDHYDDITKQAHNVRQWFHLQPGNIVQREDQRYRISLSGSSRPLLAVPLLSAQKATDVFSGSEQPVMQGWWSGKERELIPSDAFAYEITNANKRCFATLFTFSKEVTVKSPSAYLTLGTRTLRWEDDQGKHSLELDTPSGGNRSQSESIFSNYTRRFSHFTRTLKIKRRDN